MAYSYKYLCMDIILLKIDNIKPFFPVNVTVLFSNFPSFLLILLLRLFHFLQVEFFLLVDIIKVSVMPSTTSQCYSTFHSLFNKENTRTETKTKLDYISSIWDDDKILRLDERNCKCLWCNTSFQGIIST